MVQALAQRKQLPDDVLMYASVFSYNPRSRGEMIQYEVNAELVRQFESKWTICESYARVLTFWCVCLPSEQKSAAKFSSDNQVVQGPVYF